MIPSFGGNQILFNVCFPVTINRDIPFEINNFKREYSGDCWTFYLFIRENQLGKETLNKIWLPPKEGITSRHVFYDYNDTFLVNLDWHCGITWYSKEGGHDKQPRIVKAGCDYQHYWDEGKTYNVDSVLRDVHNCIDSLHEYLGEIKRWCNYCGEYFLPVSDETRCKECVDK